jgi:hypothetical protein
MSKERVEASFLRERRRRRRIQRAMREQPETLLSHFPSNCDPGVTEYTFGATQG